MGSYSAGRDEEAVPHLAGGELAGEKAEHSQLALRKLLVEIPISLLVRAKLALLAPEKLGEDAGVVGERLQDGSRLGERHPSPCSIVTCQAHSHERGQGRCVPRRPGGPRAA